MPYLSPSQQYGFSEVKHHDELVAELTKKGWSIFRTSPGGTELIEPREPRPLDIIAILVGALTIPTINAFVGLALIALGLVDNLLLTKQNRLYISKHSTQHESIDEL